MKIAVLLTCHNRSAKTEKCLLSLQKALDAYNTTTEEKIQIEIFLTDDGCTDDTVGAARKVFPDQNVLHILQGDGNLYWAGGMRFCWREAIKRHQEWDYYLLLNDDTELMSCVFGELISTENYSKNTYGKQAIVSGACCSKSDHTKKTYGGHVFTNRFLGRRKHVWSIDSPALCDTVNANVMLVPNCVVDTIGILYDKYQHSYADYDYSITARKKTIPVLLSLRTCASCDYDHVEKKTKVANLLKMSVAERKSYYRHPLHSLKDGLIYNWRISPLKIPGVVILDLLKIYLPHIYYKWCQV